MVQFCSSCLCQVGFNDLMYEIDECCTDLMAVTDEWHTRMFCDALCVTDECYAESELENWWASQTSVWKHCRGCCRKNCSWISFSTGSVVLKIDDFFLCKNEVKNDLYGRRTEVNVMLWDRYRCVFCMDSQDWLVLFVIVTESISNLLMLTMIQILWTTNV